ncbi:hypothetical protein LCGC14_1211060 [marine sediment metagenome]|uniref:Uncharacterized protein n=1 Tax=marine sediment metagenome TaxID=412755 RepID=A0A0F9PIM3_9ZZZZ
MWASGQKTVVPDSSLHVSKGDSAAADYDQTDFTWDNTWREKDMSSILPADTKEAYLRISINHSSAGPNMMFRKNGYSNEINIGKVVVNIANQVAENYFWIEVDSDRKVAYKGQTQPGTFAIVVRGWII